MDVSNTALILAARLLNVNQLLCPEWVSDTAPLSAQYVLSNSSLCAVGSWIRNESQRKLKSLKSPPARWLCRSPKIYEWVGNSTPGRHACCRAQMNWEKNESVHEVIPFSSFTQKIPSFERHICDRHNASGQECPFKKIRVRNGSKQFLGSPQRPQSC